MKAALDGLRPRQFRDDAVVLSERGTLVCRWYLAAARYSAAFVPVLWRYEVNAVLAKAQKDGILTALKANGFLATLKKLNIAVDPDSADRILTDVHRLAVTYRLTSYDASYLELALRKNLPLATLDSELIVACKASSAALL